MPDFTLEALASVWNKAWLVVPSIIGWSAISWFSLKRRPGWHILRELLALAALYIGAMLRVAWVAKTQSETTSSITIILSVLPVFALIVPFAILVARMANDVRHDVTLPYPTIVAGYAYGFTGLLLIVLYHNALLQAL